jgi:hypothetical protein
MTARRFPPPWRADKIPGGYVVRDANGQPRYFASAAKVSLPLLQVCDGFWSVSGN